MILPPNNVMVSNFSLPKWGWLTRVDLVGLGLWMITYNWKVLETPKSRHW